MKDVYLFFEGRDNYFKQEQLYLRHHAGIVSDVFNQTMGGNGAFKHVMKMWRMEGDVEQKQLTSDQVKEILRRNREARERNGRRKN